MSTPPSPPRAAPTTRPGRSMSGRDRGKYLFRIARLVQERARELAVAESLDNGKPIKESRDVDVPLVAAWFFYYAGWADKLDYAGPRREPPRRSASPAQVIPWNFPLLMLAWKIAPALAAGNTVVLKPAETTPLSALIFAEILQQADLPPGVVNIITGAGDTGAALVSAPGRRQGRLHRLDRRRPRDRQGRSPAPARRLTLELGGKAANIVFDDAPIDQAIEGIVNGIFFNQGHVCCAGSRLLVQENVHDEVVDRLKQRLSTLRLGDPLDKNTDIGAINSREQLERIRELCRHRRGRGRRALERRRASSPRTGSGSRRRSSPTCRPATASPARRSSARCCRCSPSARPPRRSRRRTTRRTACRPASGPTRASPHPRRRRPAARRRDLGEHLQPVRPVDRRSAATRSPATAARAAATASPPTSRPPDRPVASRRHGAVEPADAAPHRSDARRAPERPSRDEGIEAMTRLAVPKTYKLYIGGAFPRSESGRTYEVLTRRRATSSRTPRRRRARTPAMPSSPPAARVAGWAGATAYNRGQVLYRIAELLEGRRAQFVDEIDAAEGVSRGRGVRPGRRGDRPLGLVRGLGRQVRAGRRQRQPGRRPVLQHLGARAHRRRRDRRAAGLRRCSASSRRSRRRSSPGNTVVVVASERLPAVGDQPRRGARDQRRARRASSTCSPARRPRSRRGSRRHADVNALDLVGAGDLDWVDLADRGGRHAQARAPRPSRARMPRRRASSASARSPRPRRSGTPRA